METQTWLSCHYKFISTENITIYIYMKLLSLLVKVLHKRV